VLAVGIVVNLGGFVASNIPATPFDTREIAAQLGVRAAGGEIISIAEPQFGRTDFAGRIVTLAEVLGSGRGALPQAGALLRP
jgi:hypothetical protein